ncbi:MAG: GxxExxY protein [Anaerolineae bacterium]
MIDTGIYKDLSYQIIGAAMDVHNELGPGFPEKVYREAMSIALNQRGIPVLKEVAFDVASEAIWKPTWLQKQTSASAAKSAEVKR